MTTTPMCEERRELVRLVNVLVPDADTRRRVLGLADAYAETLAAQMVERYARPPVDGRYRSGRRRA